jgi:hypothetical protein
MAEESAVNYWEVSEPVSTQVRFTTKISPEIWERRVRRQPKSCSHILRIAA